MNLLLADRKTLQSPARRFGGCGEWCLCVRGTAIALLEWALGGHFAMSVSVLMSAARERFWLDYLADAAFPHLEHRDLPQLKTALADGLAAASFDG